MASRIFDAFSWLREKKRSSSGPTPSPAPSPPQSPSRASSPPQESSRGGSFFPQGSNFTINGSNFIQATGNQPVITEVLRLKLMRGADLDSAVRYPLPRCQVGTRVDLLKGAINWRDDAWRLRSMFWITGPAGSGKSAISQTFGEDCREAGRLGAALFLSREHHSDDLSLVVPSLAYQLAIQHPHYKHLVTTVLEDDPLILEKGLPTQFRKLVRDPAHAMRSNEDSPAKDPLVIILDGLNDCGDRAGQLELIELIYDHIRSQDRKSPFIWLICTRPEPYLMKALAKLESNEDSYCRSTKLLIDDAQSVEDVTQVFRNAFGDIREQYSDMFDLGEWPAEEQFQRLIGVTSGFFLLALDIVQFVGNSERQDPITQLEVCLDCLNNPYPSRRPNPFRSLDALYQQVLSNVHKEVLPTTLNILRLCISNLDSPPTSQTILGILGINRFALHRALQDLHSVLYVPSPETADIEGPRFYHSSFIEFLQDPSRSGEYTIKQNSQGRLMPREPGVLAALPATRISETDAGELTMSSDSHTPEIPISHDSTIDAGTSAQQVPATNSEGGMGFVSSDTSQLNTASKSLEVATLLSAVLRTSRSRRALFNLRGDQAQLMVDYLHSLLEPSFPIVPWLRKHSLIALRELSKASLLYPHCYVLKDITLGSQRSGGAFSDVHKGQHGGQDLCLKVVRLYQQSDTEVLLKIYAKEAILWGQLIHPNVAPFYGIYYRNEERNRVCLVSPWMHNGNLVDYLKNNPSAPRPLLIHDVVAGLEYLHGQSLVHSDIKGMNILVNDSERACITDFGLSFIRTDQTLAYSFAGSTVRGFSHNWAAPELLDDDARATLSSDVWALGCVFYEVLTGLLPFHGSKDFQITRKLLQGELPVKPTPMPSSGSVEEAIWKLVDRCWSLEPTDRPTCRDISQELKQLGLARKQEESLEDMIQKKRRFQDAMRQNEEIPLDLDRVRQILNEL